MIENWDNLIKLFGTHDGALPDIVLDQLSGEEVVSGYEFVRSLADRISSKGPSYWSTSKGCDVAFSINDNPAIEVVSGEAECFHLCFGGIKSPSGIPIPELGLFVFSDCLSFDYQMGPQWNKQAIQGLFELIELMSRSFNGMKISHRNNINDDDGSIFQLYWNAYRCG